MATKKITIPVYADPGHAWLKVPHKLLSEINLTASISCHSYKRGDFAYIEEDCDGQILTEALKKNGITFKFKEFHTNKQSKIRSYIPYTQLRLFP